MTDFQQWDDCYDAVQSALRGLEEAWRDTLKERDQARRDLVLAEEKHGVDRKRWDTIDKQREETECRLQLELAAAIRQGDILNSNLVKAHEEMQAARDLAKRIYRMDPEIMVVYVAVIEDRHVDIDIQVFATVEAAIAYAKAAILDIAHGEEDAFEEEQVAGCIYFAKYNYERDCVSVCAREVCQ